MSADCLGSRRLEDDPRAPNAATERLDTAALLGSNTLPNASVDSANVAIDGKDPQAAFAGQRRSSDGL